MCIERQIHDLYIALLVYKKKVRRVRHTLDNEDGIIHIIVDEDGSNKHFFIGEPEWKLLHH